jgi:hypothetical protein
MRRLEQAELREPPRLRKDAMMLSDTQLIILSAASQRHDHLVVLPPKLNGAVAIKVVNELLQIGLLQEQSAKGEMPVWRHDQEHRGVSLRVTRAGLQAIKAEVSNVPASDRDPKYSAATELVVRAARSIVPSKRQNRAPKSGSRKRSSTAKANRKPATAIWRLVRDHQAKTPGRRCHTAG